MKVDIKGRIEKMNLPKDKCFLPLYESIVNSFQSIEELEDRKEAYIKIKLYRDHSQIVFSDNDKQIQIYPINKFEIEDNGIGFNQENFNSFNTSDSTYKLAKGGKGIGRFLWLKSFENVSIESIYKEKDKNKKISFEFCLDDEPIKNKKIEETDQDCVTRIVLENLKPVYSDKTKKSLNYIGLKIIEHCLSYFLTENCPKVILQDEREILDLNDLFLQDINVNAKTDSYYIGDEEFKITHVKLYDTKRQNHRIHFCANNREVQTKKLDKIIPDAIGYFKDGDKDFIYSAYISGDLLDKNVSDERTSFRLNDEKLLDEKISMKEIEEKTIEIINHYLKDYVEPIKIKKNEKIRAYIFKEKPQYRIVLKYKPELLDKISPNIKDEELEIELFKIKQEIDRDLKEKSELFLKNNRAKDIKDLDEYKESYQKYIEMENDRGKSSLAEYITHRKVVLDLFDNAINLSEETNKYSLEKYVHNLIFPMRTTSDEITYDKHNLWIIDEKLSYHHYLASDKSMKNIEVVNSDSSNRPDLLIMDRPIVISDENNKPYNSLTIIEFKRPMRSDYTDNSNPIQQLYNYVREIRSGSKKDRRGRPLTVNENTAFYLYIIADLTDDLKMYAENYGLNETVDGMGYFGYNDIKSINAYIEIISYDKLLNDAQKKNRILFDKLFGI